MLDFNHRPAFGERLNALVEYHLVEQDVQKAPRE